MNVPVKPANNILYIYKKGAWRMRQAPLKNFN